MLYYFLLCLYGLEHVQLTCLKKNKQMKRYLYLLEQILELDQKLFGIFGLLRDPVQGLGELTLQTHTHTQVN